MVMETSLRLRGADSTNGQQLRGTDSTADQRPRGANSTAGQRRRGANSTASQRPRGADSTAVQQGLRIHAKQKLPLAANSLLQARPLHLPNLLILYLCLTTQRPQPMSRRLTRRSTRAPGIPATSPSSRGTSSPRYPPAFLPSQSHLHCHSNQQETESEAMIPSFAGQLSANVGAGVRLENGNIFSYSLRGKKAVSFTPDGLLGLNIKGRLLADKDFKPRSGSGAVELAWTILDFRKGQDVRLKAGYELYRKMPYFQVRENNWTLNGYMDGKWDVRFDM
ncbi:hypothetical protein QYE76_064928 [Lolium multiflorum]|uniref:Outer envelope pore protein 21, chloroplastic n=1 Tax=Lolium multiflorum TaxID=4521 RepID=A0AAD8S8M9_LOLMU|nr:hypothetical protein QYE76_064928 [Lolium multiflorum]